jgi:predicted dehydrogenase
MDQLPHAARRTSHPARPVPRIGLIGAGFIGAFHSKAIRGLIRAGLVEAEYVAVADVDADRAEEFARLAGVPFVTSDVEALIADERVNTVYVCTPTAQHADLILKAAAAGKAIFAEKPLATNLADARRIVEAVEAAGVPAQVGLVLRHAPIFTVLRELMRDPALGRPMTVIFHDDQFFPISGHYASAWRKDYATTGGGTLIEHSIHDLDLLAWLIGPVGAITAQTRNFTGHDRVEDLAVAMVEFENGCVGTLSSTWHHVLSRRSTRLIEVIFERGLFRVEHDFQGPIRLETAESGGARVIDEDEVRRRYLGSVGLTDDAAETALTRWTFEDLFFMRALASGARPAPDFRVALAAHELVDAVYRSAAAGGARIELRGE